jgi:protease-4
MAIDADVIVERRRLKRSRALWRLVALAVLVVLVAAPLIQQGVLRTRHVARLEITGIIDDNPVLPGAIDDIAEDDSAEALIVAIDSPGGTVTGSEAIYDALRRVAAQKPVVAVMGSTAASGGYIVALGADHIFARRNTITGSIGVLMQAMEFSGLLQKVGVVVTEVKSAPLKGEPSMFKPLDPKAREATQVLIDDAYGWFLDIVASRRGLTPEQARALGDGRAYSGKQAVEQKLIDGLGDERTAKEWLKSQYGLSQNLPVRTVNPFRQQGFLGSFDSSLGQLLLTALTGKTLESKRLTLDGLVAIWHPGL